MTNHPDDQQVRRSPLPPAFTILHGAMNAFDVIALDRRWRLIAVRHAVSDYDIQTLQRIEEVLNAHADFIFTGITRPTSGVVKPAKGEKVVRNRKRCTQHVTDQAAVSSDDEVLDRAAVRQGHGAPDR